MDIPVVDNAATPRSLTVMDMARLRLVSRVVPQVTDRQRLSISPDGKLVAFQLYQGDPETNAYRTAWFVAPTKPGGRAIKVGDGGDVHLRQLDDGVPMGDVAALSAAKWSPDGRWIYYLRQQKSEIQLWRSRADGTRQEQLTRLDADVREVFWASSERLYFTADKDSRETIRQARDSEANRGILLDDRYWFPMSKYPLRRVPQDAQLYLYDISTSSSRRATAAEKETFDAIVGEGDAGPALTRMRTQLRKWPQDISPLHFKGGNGWVAFARIDEPRDRAIFPTATLSVLTPDQPDQPVRCEAVECKGIIFSIWWSDDGREIYFERRDENLANAGFFAWSWQQGGVREILKTQASLEDCVFDRGPLICVYEATTQPDTLVLLSVATGAITPLIDPNPELRSIRFTDVERLDWTSQVGDEPEDKAFGYLIKPRDFQPGTRYPLVILTKEAHGFLFSGGEYPAHVFADNGFMVFVCQEPFASLFRLGTAGRFKNDFQVRRHTQASLEAGIGMLERRGLIDPSRIALTGFSDGADLTYFALFRSKRSFAAAIVSGPNWEPISYYLLPGYMRRGISSEQGVTLSKDGPAPWFYEGEAPSRNVGKINTPILHHIADSEVPAALQSMVTMEEYGKPFEGYVFPDEWHQKWQPAHLYEIRRRNVQWLQFWLQDKEAEDPLDPQQYIRWRKLRAMSNASLAKRQQSD